MLKINLIAMLACLAVAAQAEARVSQRGLIHQIKRGVAGPNPYIFLTVPKGRSQSLIQGFEVIEENGNKNESVDEETHNNDETDNDYEDEDQTKDNEDHEDDNDRQLNDSSKEVEDKYSVGNIVEEEDDDEDDEDDELDNVMSMNLKLRKPNPKIKNAKTTQMMVSRDNAGAILVPDEIIEIEGQSVIDEKTGKAALLLPRAILDSIPDGSVVALMERSVEDEDDNEDVAEERANRVIVRRRRKGAILNISRRRGGNKSYVVRRGSNKRNPVNKRKIVRVVRRGNSGGNRRSVNKRRFNRRRVFLQD